MNDGDVIVGWLEQTSDGSVRSRLRRRDREAARWEELPVPPAAGASGSIALAGLDDGSLVVARAAAHGRSPYRLLPPEAEVWSEIPLPDRELAEEAVVENQVAATGGATLAALVGSEARLRVHRWDGERWSMVSRSAGWREVREARLAATHDRTLYVTWIEPADDRPQLFAARFTPSP